MSAEFKENEISTGEENTGAISGETGDKTGDPSDADTNQVPPKDEEIDTAKTEDKHVESLGITKAEPKSAEEQLSAGKQIDSLVDAMLTGELTDEQKKGAEEAGLLQHLELLVAGRRAMQEKTDAEIVGVAGGREAYAEMQEWAASNMNEADIEAFNEAVLKSGNTGLAKLAIEGLKARYIAANGSEPSVMISGGGTANADSRPYSSPDEYIRETMSYEYKTNPEYAAKVESKRNSSGF